MANAKAKESESKGTEEAVDGQGKCSLEKVEEKVEEKGENPKSAISSADSKATAAAAAAGDGDEDEFDEDDALEALIEAEKNSSPVNGKA